MFRLAVFAVVTHALCGCCTLANCLDGVVWQLPASFPAISTGDTLSARVCVQGTCFEGPLKETDLVGRWESERTPLWVVFTADDRKVQVSGRVIDETRAVEASLELRRNGAVLVSESRTVKTDALMSYRPNGPLCEPSCTGAGIIVL